MKMRPRSCFSISDPVYAPTKVLITFRLTPQQSHLSNLKATSCNQTTTPHLDVNKVTPLSVCCEGEGGEERPKFLKYDAVF